MATERFAYDEEHAAEMCDVGVSEIRRWAREGRITPVYSGERASRPLYLPDELQDAVRGLPRRKGVAG